MILIIDYDLDWPLRFAELHSRLRHALGPVALRIDHIGSTSVPGLAVKPVIDIQVSVERLEPGVKLPPNTRPPNASSPRATRMIARPTPAPRARTFGKLSENR